MIKRPSRLPFLELVDTPLIGIQLQVTSFSVRELHGHEGWNRVERAGKGGWTKNGELK
jgi:hypothetical protein